MNRKQKAIEERFRVVHAKRAVSKAEFKRKAEEKAEAKRAAELYEYTRACTVEDINNYFDKPRVSAIVLPRGYGMYGYGIRYLYVQKKQWEDELDSILKFAEMEAYKTCYADMMDGNYSTVVKEVAITELKRRQSPLYKLL